MIPTADSPSIAAASFRVTIAGEVITLPANRIRAIARIPKLTRVPHAPAAMAGLANVEGSVLPIISLAKLLDYPEGAPTRLIVFDGPVSCGLLVDHIGGTTDIGETGRLQEIDERLHAMQSAPAGRSRPAMRPTVRSTERNAADIGLLCFVIGGQEFALPVAQVVEVIRWSSALTPLPGADAVALGTLPHRDVSLPVLSLAALLNLPDRNGAEWQRILVVHIGACIAGLAVAAVSGVLRVSEDRLDAVSPVLRRGAGEARIQAICRVSDGQRLVSVLAAEHLIDDRIAARLRSIDEKPTVTEQTDGQAAEEFLAFRIGEEEFGLPVNAVQEIVRLPTTLTHYPGAPPFVEGLMNLRGEVLPVIDQTRRFRGHLSAAGRRRVVVARAGDLRAGFIVDAVSEVLRVPVGDITATPELTGDQVRLFERVASIDGGRRMILIVSPKELLDRAEREMLAKMAEPPAAEML